MDSSWPHLSLCAAKGVRADRSDFHMLLKTVRRLHHRGELTDHQRAYLKNLIVREDSLLAAAVQLLPQPGGAEQLLVTLLAAARSAPQEDQTTEGEDEQRLMRERAKEQGTQMFLRNARMLYDLAEGADADEATAASLEPIFSRILPPSADRDTKLQAISNLGQRPVTFMEFVRLCLELDVNLFSSIPSE